MQSSRGSGVFVACVVGALFLLPVGWFAWNNWRSQAIASNERNAAGMIKTLASAEADFRGNDRDGDGVQEFWTGDVASLYYQFGGLIERGMADADARALSGRPPVAYQGYYFAVMEWHEGDEPRVHLTAKPRHPTRFAFCAYPVKYGVTGRNTFIINEGNTVFWSHTNGEPVDTWPTDQDRRTQWALGD